MIFWGLCSGKFWVIYLGLFWGMFWGYFWDCVGEILENILGTALGMVLIIVLRTLLGTVLKCLGRMILGGGHVDAAVRQFACVNIPCGDM